MSLITNFRELRRGTDYIYMMTESSSFDINMSYDNLIIGTFDRIYDDGDIDKFIIKDYTDVKGEGGTKISFRRTTPRGLRVFRLPTSNEEYIDLVNLIKSYGNGKKLNTKSKTIIADLENGTSPFNKGGFTYQYQSSTDDKKNEDLKIEDVKERSNSSIENLKQNYEEELCSICLESLSSGPIITTDCKHKFHIKCIDDYKRNTQNSNKCPYCRQKMFKNDARGVVVKKYKKSKRKLKINKKCKRKSKRNKK